MPRLFTGLEIPPDVTAALQGYRGGLPGARWVDSENYHVTLRFIGDIDEGTAREVEASLAEMRPRGPVTLTLDRLEAFGGSRPRAVFARVVPDPALSELQAEQESRMRQVGLKPEARRFTPHVTLARMRDASSAAVAAYIASHGAFQPLTFTAERFALYSAKASTGGGPYLVEAAYPLI
ncbi:MAG TPA: RNA 2',3'-cyclic phosphodiesterase [Microvirga sp.]|jgi:2'-5' RNA ligase|nr:RNA 2',3'-cyclic phosphodiesterase [Microvirga sp.]